ncbi:MAG: ECF transporter S component [Eubacteriaceae bacterium]|nr:ECF transporter S component [Eubacteriaceae bacterium]
MKNSAVNKRVLFITQFSLLIAIEALFCFTPLGSLPAIGPIVATLAMIPVIITALLMGAKAGAAMGAVTGLFSFIVWTFMPPSPVTAFLFTPFYYFGEFRGNFGSLLICFAPRIAVGAVTGLIYSALTGKSKEKDALKMVISSFLGSLVNTFGVMFGIWLFFGKVYASLVGQAMILVVGTTILTSGIPEAVVAAIICPAVVKPLKILLKNN